MCPTPSQCTWKTETLIKIQKSEMIKYKWKLLSWKRNYFAFHEFRQKHPIMFENTTFIGILFFDILNLFHHNVLKFVLFVYSMWLSWNSAWEFITATSPTTSNPMTNKDTFALAPMVEVRNSILNLFFSIQIPDY